MIQVSYKFINDRAQQKQLCTSLYYHAGHTSCSLRENFLCYFGFIKSKVPNPIERLERDVGKDLSEADTSHVESPSILSYKNTQQSKLRGSSRLGLNTIEVKAKDYSTHSNFDTESPSILSGDKAAKKCDTSRTLTINDVPGTSEIIRTNNRSDTHPPKSGSRSKKEDSLKTLPNTTCSATYQPKKRLVGTSFHYTNETL